MQTLAMRREMRTRPERRMTWTWFDMSAEARQPKPRSGTPVSRREQKNSRSPSSRKRSRRPTPRKYVTGKFLEVIGTYIPTPMGKQQKVTLNVEKAKEWLTKGAQPSDTVRHVLKLAGVETKPSKKQVKASKKPKA